MFPEARVESGISSIHFEIHWGRPVVTCSELVDEL
jgi:hypothetical protein